ncbi:MAG: hypothetical protein ACRDTC_19225 [Pseudonocardiaceae bacterium]
MEPAQVAGVADQHLLVGAGRPGEVDVDSIAATGGSEQRCETPSGVQVQLEGNGAGGAAVGLSRRR